MNKPKRFHFGSFLFKPLRSNWYRLIIFKNKKKNPLKVIITINGLKYEPQLNKSEPYLIG